MSLLTAVSQTNVVTSVPPTDSGHCIVTEDPSLLFLEDASIDASSYVISLSEKDRKPRF